MNEIFTKQYKLDNGYQSIGIIDRHEWLVKHQDAGFQCCKFKNEILETQQYISYELYNVFNKCMKTKFK